MENRILRKRASQNGLKNAVNNLAEVPEKADALPLPWQGTHGWLGL